jgi:hypothetical protein
MLALKRAFCTQKSLSSSVPPRRWCTALAAVASAWRSVATALLWRWGILLATVTALVAARVSAAVLCRVSIISFTSMFWRSYLVVLVVVVVAGSAVKALCRPSVASLLSISTWWSTVTLVALSTKAGLGAVSGVLLLMLLPRATVACLLALVLRCAAAVLTWRRRSVAALTGLPAVLCAGVVGRRGRGARVGAAGGRGRAVAVAVVAGGLVMLCAVSRAVLEPAYTVCHAPIRHP